LRVSRRTVLHFRTSTRSLSLYRSRYPRHLHSFPPRRSSDLPQPTRCEILSGFAPRISSCSSSQRNSQNAATTALPNTHAARCARSEEHTSELQSRENLVCRLLLEKKKTNMRNFSRITRAQQN